MAIFIWTGAGADTEFDNSDNWDGGAYSSSIPEAGDDTYFVAQYPLPCTGSGGSAELGALVVENGYTATLDISGNWASVDFSGTGESSLNLGSSDITVEIKQTASGGAGKKGLYIRGTALVGINIENGSVGVGFKDLGTVLGLPYDSTDVIGEIRVMAGDLKVASGVTLTTCYNFGGEIDLYCDLTTIHVKNGTTNLLDTAAVTTVDCLRGEFVLKSSGTVASLFVDTEGTFTATAGDDKTITALSFEPGANLSWYPSNTTIGTFTLPGDPIAIRTDGI